MKRTKTKWTASCHGLRMIKTNLPSKRAAWAFAKKNYLCDMCLTELRHGGKHCEYEDENDNLIKDFLPTLCPSMTACGYECCITRTTQTWLEIENDMLNMIK